MPVPPKCPHCGSAKTAAISLPTPLRAIVFFECEPCQRTFADKGREVVSLSDENSMRKAC